MWSEVELDHEEMAPMHEIYETLNAELEVQRTIKRAELTAFLCLFRRFFGPITARVDNKGSTDGLWRGEMICSGPKANDTDLWILIREESHRVHQEGILVEVEQRIAPRRRSSNCRSLKIDH